MAIDINQAFNEMQSAEQGLIPYQSGNLPTQIQSNVSEQWAPTMESSANVSKRMMGSFLPEFMNIPYSGYTAGTGEGDLTPQQKMQQMSSRAGGMVGDLASASAMSKYLGGSRQEMGQRALQAMESGQRNQASSYDRAFGRYQTALQIQEAEKQRQFQAEEAAKARAAARANAAKARRNFQAPQFAQPQTWRQKLDMAQGQGQKSLYKMLREAEASVGGWDNMSSSMQQELSPYWGTWQNMKGGSGVGDYSYNQLQKMRQGQGYQGPHY